MTLADIQRRASERPGICAVCDRKMPKPRLGGKPAVVCSVRLRKSCRREYQAAYVAAKKPSTMRKIVRHAPHPSVPAHVLVEMECGHTKAMLTGAVNTGRLTTKCPTCVTLKNLVAKPGPLGTGPTVVVYQKPPRAGAKKLSG